MLLCLFLGCSHSFARLSAHLKLLFSKVKEELWDLPSADLKPFLEWILFYAHPSYTAQM